MDNTRLDMLESRFTKVEDAIISLDQTSKSTLIILTKLEAHQAYTHDSLNRAFTEINTVSNKVDQLENSAPSWNRAVKYLDLAMVAICGFVGITILTLVFHNV